eukprot:CAMPEP_0174279426 /NCGR_PEP_ID=MMETSP0439-20130205/62028_1 /TAXON_ID=0 /ORGANISM="Stereomyxa ramosa, Strain Chinc5" /LENGTH=114 /DNA_ID=CAMNT_0015371949 /DNA_START=844 /DNA_END=1185 /DNA_ORIENTATION=+
MREVAEQQDQIDFENFDPHTIAGFITGLLMALPEPVFTPEFIQECPNVNNLYKTYKDTDDAMADEDVLELKKSLFETLPRSNLAVLAKIILLITKTVEKEQQNQMGFDNMVTVF